MKRLIPLFVLAFVLPALFAATVITVRGPVGTPSGGGGASPATDDFNRGSLGANWTVADGGAIIAGSTELNFTEGSFGENIIFYSAGVTSDGAGYVTFTRRDGATYPMAIFRYTNSTSPFYALEFSNSDVTWVRRSQIGGTNATVGSTTSAVLGDNVRIGITYTGTGTSTEIRVWNLGSLASTPTTASNWDGDTTPDVSWTDNPASPVDTGGYVGLGCYQGSANAGFMDDFFAGPL